MQAGAVQSRSARMYLTQITEDGELAVLFRSNQYPASFDQVTGGGVKIQKRYGDKRHLRHCGKCYIKEFTCNYFERGIRFCRRKTVQENEII